MLYLGTARLWYHVERYEAQPTEQQRLITAPFQFGLVT